jgi:hypothetical protein
LLALPAYFEIALFAAREPETSKGCDTITFVHVAHAFGNQAWSVEHASWSTGRHLQQKAASTAFVARCR